MRVLKILHDIQCLRYIKSTTITVMAYSKQSYSLLRHHCIDHILSNFVIFYFFLKNKSIKMWIWAELRRQDKLILKNVILGIF